MVKGSILTGGKRVLNYYVETDVFMNINLCGIHSICKKNKHSRQAQSNYTYIYTLMCKK